VPSSRLILCWTARVDFELGEWLDGRQMAEAKRYERLKEGMLDLIGKMDRTIAGQSSRESSPLAKSPLVVSCQTLGDCCDHGIACQTALLDLSSSDSARSDVTRMATAKLGQIQSIGEPLEHNSPRTGGMKELDELFRGRLNFDPAHEWLWGPQGERCSWPSESLLAPSLTMQMVHGRSRLGTFN